jgi:hypothetical protein
LAQAIDCYFEDDSLEFLVSDALDIIQRDYRSNLREVDRYLRGDMRSPYSPKGMTAETKAMMRRAKQNWCEIPVNAATQALAADGYRPGRNDDADSGRESVDLTRTPEWSMWQRSNLDAKQSSVHRAAIAYGQQFVLSELGEDGVAYAKMLSPLFTTALFEDPLADDNAVLALTVLRWSGRRGGKDRSGRAVAWDRYNRYEVVLPVGGAPVIREAVPHGGAGHCPVTRFVSSMDAEGRVVGSVRPIIPWQDTFNQMLFNLLIAQSDGAHRLLYGTGLKPDIVIDSDGNPVLDEDTGLPQVVPIDSGPGGFLGAEDPQAKFGAIQGEDLKGYIDSLDMLIKDFSALTQTPPNFLLGQMANLSADALNAAEKSFRRKVGEYQRLFGEAWERVLRIGMILEGRSERDDAEHSEILWRDFENAALSQTADALAKLSDGTGVGIPKRGLWEMVPGVTPLQIAKWNRLADQQDSLNSLGQNLDDYADMLNASADSRADSVSDDVDG